MMPAMQKEEAPRALTVWLTGLSGAGKSTLAGELKERLAGNGMPCYVLDGDGLRSGISRDLGFTPRDRHENIRRAAEIARLMNEAGLVVVAAFISPYREDRRMAREIIGEDRFIEAYLNASLQVCESRDPKGLYRKARAGKVAEFTGVSAPYEPPDAPSIVLPTGKSSIDECVAQLFQYVSSRLAASGPR